MVWKFFSYFASKAVSLILEGRKDVLRKVTHETHDVRWLHKGDELCRGMVIATPMSTELCDKVIDIYKKCKSKKGDTALMLALDMGLMDMVWGFIQCAKQTNTNLHTGQKGDECVQEFLCLHNEKEQTAFDIAVTKGHVDVAKLLLNNVHRWCLRSQWIRRREALLQLIDHDPKFDGFIFDMLEDRATIPVHIKGQEGELKIYNKGVARIVTQEFLNNLGKCLLGSDASKNSVLHLVSKIGNVPCIECILENDPFLIHSLNSDMETPLYVAAREGCVDNLRYMINFIKQENQHIESNIVTRCIDNHNALHIAIQNHHIEVIFMLITEFPQLGNCVNESKESPLYLAAERGYFGVVKLLIKKCRRITYEGPNGRTALHAAAISDSPECVEHLLHENHHLLNVKDDHGWTPLHHAVYRNSSLAATKLLDSDFSIGYDELIAKDSIKTSPIHLAASLGHCETMKVLMDLCPGCSDFIDDKGRNILHVAIENKKIKAIEFMFRDEALTNLIDQKDMKGNTPIHLLEMLIDSMVDINPMNDLKLIPLEMVSSYDKRKRLIKAINADTRCVNDKTSCALSGKEKQSEAKEDQLDKHFMIVDSLVVVAALIATASFAAAFTLPGGLESGDGSQKGTPFLLKEPAFQAFVVTNAIAFSFSCCSLLSYIELLLYRNRYHELWLDEQEHVDGKVETMYLLTTLALVAMTIAFVTGQYVVLTPLLGFAIAIIFMCLFIRGVYHVITYEATCGLKNTINEDHLLMAV